MIRIFDIIVCIITILLKPVIILGLAGWWLSGIFSDDKVEKNRYNDLGEKIVMIYLPAEIRVSSNVYLHSYSSWWAFDRHFYPISIKKSKQKII